MLLFTRLFKTFSQNGDFFPVKCQKKESVSLKRGCKDDKSQFRSLYMCSTFKVSKISWKKRFGECKIEQVLIMWTNHKGFVTIRSFAVEFLIFVKVWLVDFVLFCGRFCYNWELCSGVVFVKLWNFVFSFCGVLLESGALQWSFWFCESIDGWYFWSIM